jgi:hypothetical protein
MPILLSSKYVGKKIFKVSTFLIYFPLERLSSVPVAETHEQILKQSKWGDDGSFWYGGGGNEYLVVSFDQVNLAEDGAAVQAIGQ